MAKRFYVTCKDAGKTGWLVGPFETHEAALAVVDKVRERAIELQPRAHWYYFGTSSIERETEKPFPAGNMNTYFPELFKESV